MSISARKPSSKNKKRGGKKDDNAEEILSMVIDAVEGAGAAYAQSQGIDYQTSAERRAAEEAAAFDRELQLEQLRTSADAQQAAAESQTRLVEALVGSKAAAPAAEAKDDKTMLYVGGAVVGLGLLGLAVAASR